MSDLTIATLCQALANITNNRCYIVENSNTCRCVDNIMGPKPTTVVSTAPNIMLSELFLIFFVLALWLSAVGFCLNQYKSLRRLETQVHYYGDRKDPLNIGDIKIVAREQDSIIYKKKRYSTVLDTHIGVDDLKTMQYVKEYLPKNVSSTTTTTSIEPSSIGAVVVSREDLTANIPLSITPTIPMINSREPLTPTSYFPLSTHDEVSEEQQSPAEPTSSSFASFVLAETGPKGPNGRMSFVHLADGGRISTSLAVPRISTPCSLRSSLNGSHIFETSRSAQHLSVPSNGLRSNRYSESNIAFPVPDTIQNNSENPDEQLLDPRLIPNTVRRSLLALHRESQDNINMQRSKEKTQSENDVHGSFTPWKLKMKSKLKRTHHHHPNPQQSPRTYTRALSVLPTQNNSNEHERRVSAYATMNQEYRFSTPPSRNYSISRNPSIRRSLKYYPKYSTQSTSESETTQVDIPTITSIYVSTNDDKSTITIDETDGESSLTLM